MKKIILVMILMLFAVEIFACDLCSIYIGIEPKDYKNSFGVRYRYRAFESDFLTTNNASNLRMNNYPTQRKGVINDKHLDESTFNGSENETFTYSETFISYDVFANFYLNKRFQLNVTTYFADNYTYKNDSTLENISGIGDITITATYQLYNTKQTADTSKKLIHRVNVGAGVAIPTGNYNKKSIVGFQTKIQPYVILGSPIEELDPHMQSGTGAFSSLFILEYLVKYKNIGLSSNLSYKANTENKNNFRFANRFNANSNLFYLGKISKNLTLMPTLGTAMEFSNRDTFENYSYLGSGGEVWFANLGTTFFIKNWGINFIYYMPVYQRLNDVQPENKNRAIAQLTYYFN